MRLAILGAGPGGYVAALRAARLGAQVTVIEAYEVGGTCLHWGCIPTKTMLASSEILSKVRDSSRFGIELSAAAVPNLSKIIGRKNTVIATQVKGIRGLFKSWGITLSQGQGRLVSPREIEVVRKDGDTEKIEADRIIIATGSRPARIPTLPFDGRNIISSNEALDLAEIPKSLLVVGAGVVGCEFACIYREFGTDVTIVEALPRAVATEDQEISELLAKELGKKKIRLFTNTRVESAHVEGSGVRAVLSDGKELIVEKLLVAVGREFNSSDIGIENAGIRTGRRGEIFVNNRMETSAEGLYAVGDVTGGPLLAHVASAGGKVAAENAMGLPRTMDREVVPAAIFTTPEIASVGLREHEAAERGVSFRTGRFPFRTLAKAHAMGEIAGFVKIIAEEPSGRIIGAHIIGPHASDLIHEAALAMRAGLTAGDIAETIHAHPTLSEGLMEAAEDVLGKAVHLPRR